MRRRAEDARLWPTTVWEQCCVASSHTFTYPSFAQLTRRFPSSRNASPVTWTHPGGGRWFPSQASATCSAPRRRQRRRQWQWQWRRERTCPWCPRRRKRPVWATTSHTMTSVSCEPLASSEPPPSKRSAVTAACGRSRLGRHEPCSTSNDKKTAPHISRALLFSRRHRNEGTSSPLTASTLQLRR